MHSLSVSCPAWPKGVWPRSCASATASTKSSFRPKRPGDGAAQLRDFERVREPRAKQIAFVVQKHLCFVDQPPECGGVHDAVTVTLESIARGRRRASANRRPRLCAGSQASADKLASGWLEPTGKSSDSANMASGAAGVDHLAHHGVGRTTHGGLAGAVDHHKLDIATDGFFIEAHVFDVMACVVASRQ